MREGKELALGGNTEEETEPGFEPQCAGNVRLLYTAVGCVYSVVNDGYYCLNNFSRGSLHVDHDGNRNNNMVAL